MVMMGEGGWFSCDITAVKIGHLQKGMQNCCKEYRVETQLHLISILNSLCLSSFLSSFTGLYQFAPDQFEIHLRYERIHNNSIASLFEAQFI